MFSRLQFYWSYLTSDPAGFLVYILYFAVTILISLILHEVAHGWVALKCGDPTAKWMGRLSLDPRKHLDPVGTVCMLVLGIGWAKPVPVNPRNFQNKRRDDFLVSIAGICMNLSLFILCAALSVGVNRLLWRSDYLTYLKDYHGTLEPLVSPYWTVGYALMNGNAGIYADAMARPWLQYVQRFLLMMGQMNLSLAAFNLLPIPPLDGYHIFNDLLLKGRFQLNAQTFRIAQLVLMLLCFSGAFGTILSRVNSTVYGAVIHLLLLMTGGA